MTDEGKTKRELRSEITRLRRQIAELSELDVRRKQAEGELRQTNAFLRNILESSSSISIISTDLDHNILYWNSGAENIFGYKAGEVVGRRKIDILYDKDDESNPVEKIRSALLGDKRGASYELREVTRDGRKLWINMTLTPRFDDNGEVIGILGIGEDITERKRAEEELQKSMKRLRKSLDQIIQVIVSTVESRDTYTAGHQQRVTELALRIAEEMGLSENRREGLRMAGLIHDLGKIAVPAEILSNPGRMSDIQFSMIKTHPQVGYDILKDIDFPWPIARIILQHHERLDGSGYPNGLKGNDIILEARILAVADVVEAIASHRPYRASLGLDMALEEIEKNKGTVYDAEAVEACVRLFREKKYGLE